MHRSPLVPILRRLPLLAAALVALIFVAAAHPARAQGVISGKVVDDKGAPMSYVDVNLEPEEGYTHSDNALTDDAGAFRFPAVPVGNYKLSANADGQKPRENIVHIGVTPGSSQSFTITMVPLSVETVQVIVQGNLQDIVDIKKTDTSSTISSEFVSKIPIQNKRIQDIVFLFPGVTRSGSSDSDDISIGGGTSQQIGYRLNGQNINDPVNGGPIIDVPTAAIDSFKLITTGFNAEYGEQSSGIAEIVTKSGKDDVDFSYGMDFRDTAFGAQKIGGLDTASKHWNDLLTGAGTLGGPDLRLGFNLLGIDRISSLDDDHNPTPRHRVRHTISSGGPVVPNKVFFHATLEQLADDYGNPYADGMTETDQTLFTAKMNWNVFEQGSKRNGLELTATADVSDDGGFFASRATRSINQLTSKTAWTVAATDTNVFNDTTVLETKLNLTHTSTATRPEDVRAGVGTQYQIYLPPAGFLAYTTGAANQSFDETIDGIRLESNLSKEFDWGGRKHNLKAGAAFTRTGFRSYNETGDFVRDLRVVNDRTIFTVNEKIGNIDLSGPPVRTDDASWQASVFVQDNWQVTDKLTIDIGSRVDYQSFVKQFVVGPRFGFSLDPIGDGKTRFYGNWGLFYDNVFANALEFAQQPDSFYGDLFFLNNYNVVGSARFSQIPITRLYQEALATPPTSRDPFAIATIRKTIHDRYRVSDDLQAPSNDSWSVGVERQLPGNTRMQLSFSGIHRSHQLRTSTQTISVDPYGNDWTVRDVILESTGVGNYSQWAFEFQRPISKKWEANLSYTHSRNIGPIAPPDNPVDPNDVYFVQGLLGNDRTHVIKLQSHAIVGVKAKLDLSGDFTWQSGTPITAQIVTQNAQALYPLGRNTLRLPSSRQLNFGMQRAFHTADSKLNITGRVSLYNLLNQLNVYDGIATFQRPNGTQDPESFPPLRPEIIATGVDVSRSAEVGIVIGF